MTRSTCNYQVARTTKFATVMRSAAFVRGFAEGKAGIPLDGDAFADTNSQLRYERGRQFAIVFKGDAIKRGHKVLPEAIMACAQASRDGSIV